MAIKTFTSQGFVFNVSLGSEPHIILASGYEIDNFVWLVEVCTPDGDTGTVKAQDFLDHGWDSLSPELQQNLKCWNHVQDGVFAEVSAWLQNWLASDWEKYKIEDSRNPPLQKEPYLRYHLRYFFPRDGQFENVSPPKSVENWTRLSDRVHPELVSPLCELDLFALNPHSVNPFDGREGDRVLYIHNDDLERFLWFRLEAKLKFELEGRFSTSDILDEVRHLIEWRDRVKC